MVRQIGATTAGNVKRFEGLSTDVKPTEDVGYGSTFWEENAADGIARPYLYSINVNPNTGNNWWRAWEA